MEKITGGKTKETRRGMPLHSSNPGQHSPASRYVGYIHHHLIVQKVLVWTMHLIPTKAQGAENKAVIVQSVSVRCRMDRRCRCEETGTSWRKAPIDEVSSYIRTSEAKERAKRL